VFSFPSTGSEFALERRQHERQAVPEGDTVAVELEGVSTSRRGLGLLRNLSEGGMCVRLWPPAIRLHTTFPVKFVLFEQDGYVKVSGKVCWVSSTDFAGIRFLFRSDKSQECIVRWIAVQNGRQERRP
jgi:PilZ domain